MIEIYNRKEYKDCLNSSVALERILCPVFCLTSYTLMRYWGIFPRPLYPIDDINYFKLNLLTLDVFVNFPLQFLIRCYRKTITKRIFIKFKYSCKSCSIWKVLSRNNWYCYELSAISLDLFYLLINMELPTCNDWSNPISTFSVHRK